VLTLTRVCCVFHAKSLINQEVSLHWLVWEQISPIQPLVLVFDHYVCVQGSDKVEILREGLPHPCGFLVVKLLPREFGICMLVL